MRTTWSALYTSLHRSMNRVSAENAFQEFRRRHPDLGRFASIPTLLQHLQRREGDPGVRYHTIRALVVAAQAEGDLAATAAMLVIIALWPGLSGVHCRLRRDFPDEEPDLGGDILARMNLAIARADLDRIKSVAGTLIRSVERDIRRELVRARKRAQRSLDITNPCVEAEADCALDNLQPGADLGDLLISLSPENTALLMRVLVLGETQEEAGRALGLSGTAARKRVQRCIRHLRDQHLGGCPIPVARLAFPPVKDRKGPRKGV